MGEQTEEIKRIPAEASPWYWLYMEGAETWNRYFISALNDYQKRKYGLERFQPLTSTQRKNLESKIKQKCPEKEKFEIETRYIIDFSNMIWPETCGKEKRGVDFSNYIFPHLALFHNSIFMNHFSCKNALFLQSVTFDNSQFMSIADFTDTIFCDYASFRKCTFSSWAAYIGTTLRRGITFEETIFKKKVPHMQGISNGGSISFQNAKWLTEKKESPSYEDVQCFATLKREMNQAHMYKEEIDFFAKELEYRSLMSNLREKFLISLYHVTSDFGRSITRPTLLLLGLIIIFTFIYQCVLLGQNAITIKAYLMSLQSTFPFIPVDKALHSKINVHEGLNGLTIIGLQTMRVLQTILSTILLFLIGLGIRNRLRIK
jgi:hypothetical protein